MLLALWSTVNEAATPGGSGAILTRSTRLTQPQGPVSVDWSNPIARGLLIAAPGATSGEMRNAVDGRAFTRAYAPTTPIASTPVGLGFLNDNSSYDELSVGQDLSELTALVVTFKPATGGKSFSGPFSIGVESNNTQAITVEDGLYFSCWSSTGARSNALASGVTLSPIGAVQTLALSLATSTTTMRGYVNGSRAATGSAPSTLRSTLSSSFRVGANHADCHGAIHPAAFLWSRQLTDEEIASVSANPWQLFSPVQRRIYFDMGAGGGGTTHTVTTDPVDQGSTTTRPGLTQTHVTTASAVAQGATVSRPAITQTHVVEARPNLQASIVTRPSVTQTHVVTARAVAQGSTVNAPAVDEGSITVVTARPVVQSSTVKAPSIVQTHIVTARPAAQGSMVGAPSIVQAHVLTAMPSVQGATVTRPSLNQTHTVTARAVTQSSVVNAPGIWQTHVTSARVVVQGSTINAPGLVQTHVVTASPVVQASTVRIAPPFVRSIYWASVPSETFRASVPSEKFSAAVPSEKFRAAVPGENQ